MPTFAGCMNAEKKIPTHLAIIMDGNGRWAKLRGKERSEGHVAGMEALRNTVQYAAEVGIKYLTVYAFSTENWGRPQEEVEALMGLICKGVEMEASTLVEAGIKVVAIGDRKRFSSEVLDALNRIEGLTAKGERMTFVLALNYSSRSELTVAVRDIAERFARRELNVEAIDEKLIASALYTAEIPDPDLIIRTSGECRLSNFLLWQASYAELYFTNVLWPDFDRRALDEALEAYTLRDRRYGLVKQ